MRHRPRAPRRRLASAVAALATLATYGLLMSPAAADDRDLLRFDSAKPYLFIVLDTSASMAMKMGKDEWAPGGADGPDSRMFQAKQALFNVLRDVDDVHFGFVGFNQDGTRAVAKHWLYYNETPLPPAADWPIQFPRADVWDVDGDGSRLTRLRAIPRVDERGNPIPSDTRPPDTRVTEIGNVDPVTHEVLAEADLMTFGPPLETPAPDAEGRVIAGSCASPIDLDVPVERDRLESLAIFPSAVNPTHAWVKTGNATYLLSVSRPGNRPDGTPNAQLGKDKLHVVFDLKKVAPGNASCGTGISATFDGSFGNGGPARTIRRDLRLDPFLNQFFHVNHHTWAVTATKTGPEATIVGGWLGKDVISESKFENAPHTGFGWEGNYDSGVVTEDDAFNQVLEKSGLHEADFHCDPASGCATVNVKPQQETTLSPDLLGRAYDSGDMLPFDFNQSRRNELLRRLDPEFDPDFTGLGDFRVARHFADAPISTSSSTTALPRVDGHVPLLAADLSPLGRTLADIRCWYLGSSGQGGNKCKETTFDEGRFDQAWSQVACARDSSFGCRRNFLILLSDGGDNVPGQDANGAVGNLQNSAGTLTWALNLGDPKGCRSGGGLHSIVTAGKGECINVQTQERLRQVLESLIGQFRTTARSFASAAVPSVQATVEQKIFLTSFLPFNDTPVWKGSVHAFVKPLPVTSSGLPLTEKKCDGSGSVPPDQPADQEPGGPDLGTQGCHLWDGGEMLLAQYPPEGKDYLDVANVAQRRVLYAMQGVEPGDWARRMRLFDPLAIDAAGSRDARFDLWRGMGLSFDANEPDADPTVNAGVASTANNVVDFTLRLKTGSEVNKAVDPPVTTTHQFLIGDIFHSTPVVIGTPSNTAFFAADLYGNGRPCDPDQGTAAANPGYRCFFQKQRFRRKMLLLGSNDGMLHAFDAGMFRTSGSARDHWTGADLVHPQSSPFGSFDNGTGKELFGFVPRSVLPRLREMAQPNAKHRFTVDGTVTVADVFLDPLRQSASGAFPVAAEREWRTVVIGGLREGGRGYYALDITQPDPVEAHDDLGFLPITASSGSNHPQSGDYVPECSAVLQPNALGVVPPPSGSGCGPAPFPAALWEFTDSFFDPADGRTWFADEEVATAQAPDGSVQRAAEPNGRPDLAATWSTPNVGRIRLCRTGGTACDPTPDDPDASEDDDLIDVFVAVVGGGMDAQTKMHDWRSGPPIQDGENIAAGNWIYIIDVETGEAIYKREVQGAAASEPAAVDTNSDGYLDRIYFGTIGGFLYRIDLGPIDDGGDDALPSQIQQPVVYTHRVGNTVTHRFDQTRARLPVHVYPPVKLFDTHFDDATPLPAGTPPRAIFHRPSVIFQAGSGQYVLAFGTGDREDLWNIPVTAPNERFYVFVDPFESTADISTPMTEASLAAIDPETTAPTTSNLLASSGGWVMRLAPKERVITDAFALSGVTVFSSFVPRTEDADGNEVIGCVDGQLTKDSSTTCAKQGVSHVFVVNTTNANGLLFEGDTDVTTRFRVAPTFVTNPFAEPGQTQSAGSANDAGEHTADDLSRNMRRVMETLKGLFPPQCKFANYRIDIKTVAADTSLQFIAPVPVCLIESNWKEF